MRKSIVSSFHYSVFIALAVALAVVILVGIMTARPIVNRLGSQYAENRALLERNRVMSLIGQEVQLARKLADSPLLKQWCSDENNPLLKKAALAELENYRIYFRDKSYFYVVGSSLHYYYNNATGDFTGKELLYKLNPQAENDSWYFRTLKTVDDYALNVDANEVNKTIKVWINVIVRENGKPVGVAGSGIDITDFVDQVVQVDEPGIEMLLVDSDGVMQVTGNEQINTQNATHRQRSEKALIYDLLDTAEDKLKLKNTLQKASLGDSSVLAYDLRYEGKPHMAAVVYIPQLNWYTLVLLDMSKIFSVASFTPVLVVIISVLILTMLALGYTIRRLVLKPLVSLTGSVQQVASGAFDTKIPVENDNEIGTLAATFNDMAQQVHTYTTSLESLVAERTLSLEQSNKRLHDSITYARSILDAVLPTEEQLTGKIGDSFLFWSPRDIVGGDFYQVTDVPGGRYVIVGDCTGHGVPGAFMVLVVTTLLRQIVPQHPDAPAKVIEELNRSLKDTISRVDSLSESDNGLDIGICFIPDNADHLLYAGARISLFVAENGAVEEVTGDKFSIGYCRTPMDIAVNTVRIDGRCAKSFYLMSDGILDQAGGDKGYGFGRLRMTQAIQSGAHLPMSEQKQKFCDTFESYTKGIIQRDDIVFIGFRIH